MALGEIIAINIAGVTIGVFSLYVTIRLQLTYAIEKTVYFIYAALSIEIWNISHLVLNFIPSSNYGLARGFWLANLISAMLILQSAIFAFILLNNDRSETKLIVYNAFFILFLSIFIENKDIMDVYYSDVEGWVDNLDHDNILWVIFQIVSLIFLIFEGIIPLFLRYKASTTEQQKYILGMIVSLLLTLLANSLIAILIALGFPFSLKYLISNICFLIFFVLVYHEPYIGFYDSAFINGLLLSTNMNIKATNEGKINQIDFIQQLNQYKNIMHPVRIAILKTLSRSGNEFREDLRKQLDLNSGHLEFHLKALTKENYLTITQEFVNEKPRSIIHLNTEGKLYYDSFCDTLKNMIIT